MTRKSKEPWFTEIESNLQKRGVTHQTNNPLKRKLGTHGDFQ